MGAQMLGPCPAAFSGAVARSWLAMGQLGLEPGFLWYACVTGSSLTHCTPMLTPEDFNFKKQILIVYITIINSPLDI